MKGTRAAVASHLPVHPRVFAVLLSLAEGPSHGYAIKSLVEERSEGAIVLDPGSLYRRLSALLEEGLVEETERPKEADGDDPRRRYYRLTKLGREVAAAEARRLQKQLALGSSRRLLAGKADG